MGDATGIEWTDATWNPVTGCTKVSQGCKNCYAEREWPRMVRLVPSYSGRDFTDVRTHAERLDKPLHWKRPRRIFVNSMSDLFHEDVPDDFIDQVFAVMALAPQHTFQVLTKRAARMREYLSRPAVEVRVGLQAMAMCFDAAVKTNGHSSIGQGVSLEATDINPGGLHRWPLPNVHLGVSIEDQPSAHERIPLLLDTPAAMRWVSAEPLLGNVYLRGLFGLVTDDEDVRIDALEGTFITSWYQESGTELGSKLDWIVVGGESGPKARPSHPDWVRSLRAQCAAAGVPFLFKQWGEFIVPEDGAEACRVCGCTWNNACKGGCYWHKPRLCSNCVGKAAPVGDRAVKFRRVGKRAAGRLLDGVLHDGYPGVVK